MNIKKKIKKFKAMLKSKDYTPMQKVIIKKNIIKYQKLKEVTP